LSAGALQILGCLSELLRRLPADAAVVPLSAHDIADAQAAGLASCLVETGVSAATASGPVADFVLAAFAPP